MSSKKKFKYLVTFKCVPYFQLRFKVAKMSEESWLIVKVGSMKDHEILASSLEYAFNIIKHDTINETMREKNVTRNKAKSLIGKLLIEEI